MIYQKKVKLISTKGLIEDLITKYSILNAAKYIPWGVFQNYLAFISANVRGKYQKSSYTKQ